MKKLLIGMLITCSLGLAGCGGNNTENSTPNNGSGTGVTDGTNSNGTGVTDGTSGNNGMNGNGATGDTNSNTNGTNNQGSSLSETKTSLNNLYTELKEKVQGGVENINSEDWDKYSTEFKGKIANLKNTVEDASMRSTIDDIENLFNQYDTAIRDKTDLAKDKVKEMQDKIENSFK